MERISLLNMLRRRRNRREQQLRNGNVRTLIGLLVVVDSWVECLEVFLLYVQSLLPSSDTDGIAWTDETKSTHDLS